MIDSLRNYLYILNYYHYARLQLAKGCHFKGEGHEGTLIIPIYEEELKYYYANFKDYYYLPTEDAAFYDLTFITKDNAADLILLQIQDHALNAAFK